MMDNTNGVVEQDDNSNRGLDIERIKAAKKRRSIQLKKWYQYDKLKDKEEQLRFKKGYPSLRKGAKCVRFNQNLILLEGGYRGDIDEVRRLLNGGVCADVSNDDGLTALHQAAINNNIELCHLLVQHKANVNVKDKELWTPLHAAAIFGHKEICALLIKNGADLMSLNGDGNMPYDICEDEETLDEIEGAMSRRGITQEQINEARLEPERRLIADVKYLLGRHSLQAVQAACRQLDKQGATLLHVTAANGWPEAAKLLLEQVGVPPDVLDRDGWQCVHVAALYGHMDVVEALVSHGADLDALTVVSGNSNVSNDGETVYELVDDQDIYDQLLVLRREVDRVKKEQQEALAQQQQKYTSSSLGGLALGSSTATTTGVSSSFGLIRRRSSTNPRSASIRRTSMKEKSNLSWKEARQEAEIRRSIEKKSPATDNNSEQSNGIIDQPSYKPHPVIATTTNGNVSNSQLANQEERGKMIGSSPGGGNKRGKPIETIPEGDAGSEKSNSHRSNNESVNINSVNSTPLSVSKIRVDVQDSFKPPPNNKAPLNNHHGNNNPSSNKNTKLRRSQENLQAGNNTAVIKNAPSPSVLSTRSTGDKSSMLSCERGPGPRIANPSSTTTPIMTTAGPPRPSPMQESLKLRQQILYGPSNTTTTGSVGGSLARGSNTGGSRRQHPQPLHPPPSSQHHNKLPHHNNKQARPDSCCILS